MQITICHPVKLSNERVYLLDSTVNGEVTLSVLLSVRPPPHYCKSIMHVSASTRDYVMPPCIVIIPTSVKREINPKRAEGRKVLESAGTIKTLFYLSHRDLGC